MTSSSSAVTEVPAGGVRASTDRVLRFARRHIVFVAPVLVYLLLVLTGVTNSNIGIDSLREDAADPAGVQWGSSQGIRSDEWGTESPIWLGQMARGGQEDTTPLSTSNDFFAQLPSGPATTVVFFDGTVLAAGEWFPNEMLFASKWWLPTLLLFIGLPVWFRQISGSARWGYFAAALVFLAPGSMWWSGRPVNTLGFMAAGCALAIYAARVWSDRRWVTGTVAVLGSGVLLARFATYYQPLAIVIGLPLVLATAVYLLTRDTSWRSRLLSLGAIAASGLVWTALVFWENREAIIAVLSTTYPGDRKSTGGALDIGMVFGATALGWIKDMPVNQSEMATAFTVLLAVLAVLIAAAPWRGDRGLLAVVVALSACAAFWLSWGTFDWRSLGAALPIANRVPNTRAMLGVGYIAILVFSLFMTQWTPSRRWAVPTVAGLTAGFLSGYAGSSLGVSALPQLTVAMIWGSALITGVVVFTLVRWPARWWSWVACLGAATLLVLSSTPVLFGLGDLRASATAQEFLDWGKESRAAGTTWASESQDVDSLMMATGTPTLSARQQMGPDVDSWMQVDPDAEHEEMWNRGGLHVQFDWTDDDSVEFTQPTPDIIVVHISPCELAERLPGFRYAVSSEPLEQPCLSSSRTFQWGGTDYTVYEVLAVE